MGLGMTLYGFLVFWELALMAGLAIRIVALGLRSRYFWFFTYVVGTLVLTALGHALGGQSRVYCLIYWASQPITLSIGVMMSREVLSGIYQSNPGARQLTGSILWLLLGVSSIVGFVGVYGFQTVKWKCPGLECEFVRFLQLQYYLQSGLIVFLLLAVWELRKTTRVHWNETVHAIVLSFSFFLDVALHFLFYALGVKHVNEVNAAALGGNLLCLSLWIVLLRRTSVPILPCPVAPGSEEAVSGLRAFRVALENLRRQSDRTLRGRIERLRSQV